MSRQLSRVAKLLVDAEGIGFAEAERRLRSMTLEIRVGACAMNPAGHAAVLTALAVGRRTFLGGVRVIGDLGQPLQSSLSPRAWLEDAIADIGTTSFAEPAAMSIGIGTDVAPCAFATWWDGWRAGVRQGEHAALGVSNNPLAGVAAGAHAVGAAFNGLRCGLMHPADIDLWPTFEAAPDFSEVFLPSACWLMGLGNLGQAFLWSLAALPYADGAERSLVLQDFDRVSEENWGTSILVPDDRFGELKTKLAEGWAEVRGFKVRRLDRALQADLKLANDEPRLALSGFDKVAPRRLLAGVGFEAIIDVGLGRTAFDFDRYRVNVFDQQRRIDAHFAGMTDAAPKEIAPDLPAYQQLQSEIGRCGAAEIGNASVAVPYVSAVAGATAIARAIAITSGQACAPGEVQRVSAQARRPTGNPSRVETRGIGHAGNPKEYI
ncbi:MAG: hypothetical protein KDE21_02325 [Novosphingobium sp.]|nr:hypothetical protein [Novosphingobium sp.]